MKIGNRVEDTYFDIGKTGVIVERIDHSAPFAYYWRVKYSDGTFGLYNEHELRVINEE